MQNKTNRIVFGALIGLLGGISFGFTILPMVVERILPEISTGVYLGMATYAVPAALLWIPGGGLTGMRGGAYRGARIMGIAGAIAGLIYGVLISMPMISGDLIGLSAIVGAIYGAGAGLLVGGGFPPLDE